MSVFLVGCTSRMRPTSSDSDSINDRNLAPYSDATLFVVYCAGPHCNAIDAAVDPGLRGRAARDALRALPPEEPLIAPGHFAVELLSGLWAAARRPSHPLNEEDVPAALADASALEIVIEATPWADVHRAWELSRQSLRYSDAIYVAAAERAGTTLLTADARIARSGANLSYPIRTIEPKVS